MKEHLICRKSPLNTFSIVQYSFVNYWQSVVQQISETKLSCSLLLISVSYKNMHTENINKQIEKHTPKVPQRPDDSSEFGKCVLCHVTL